MIDHAVDLCRNLSSQVEVGIVTNGILNVQQKRLARSGLEDMISFMVTSEECGFNKPDRRIFDYALTKAKSPAQKVLMVGDRLETDILGAHKLEFDSCWFNPNKNPVTIESTPTFEISHLSELYNYLN